MYKVIADFKCGCFRKSGLEKEIEIENKEDAIKQAKSMVDRMKNEFCGTHHFSIKEDIDAKSIYIQAEVSEVKS